MTQMLTLLLQLLVAAFIVRFHCNAARLHFNPLARRLDMLTEALVFPIREAVKKILLKTSLRIPVDPSPLLAAWIIAVLGGLLLLRSFPTAFLFATLLFFLGTWLNIIIYSIFISVIASWLQTPAQQPLLQICHACHAFVLRPLRKIIPPLGMIDITPMIALFALFFLQKALLMPLAGG